MKPTLALRSLLLASALLGAANSAQAIDYTWDAGGGTTRTWQTASNWNGDTVPTFDDQANIIFNTGTINLFNGVFGSALGADRTIGSLTFNNTATTACTLALASSTSDSTAQILTLGSASVAPTITVDAASANHTIGGALGSITLANNLTATINGTKKLSIALPINGAFGLTKQGTGTLTLTGSNTYTGNTTISGGVLDVSGSGAHIYRRTSIVTGKTVTVENGGVLAVNLFGASTGTAAATTTSLGALDFAASNLVLNGGTLRIADTGSRGRAITIGANGGTIEASSTYTMLYHDLYANSYADNSVLTLSGTGAATISKGITGTGVSVVKNGNGSWTLAPNVAATHNYTGGTTINAGKLVINGDHSAATGNVTVSANATLGGSGIIGGDTSIAEAGKLEFNLSTVPGSHDKLELAAGKTLTFAGASTLTLTSISGGTTGSYTLLTAPGGITWTTAPTVSLPAGWAYSTLTGNGGTDLVINITSTGDPYANWAGAAAFDDDANGDGVSNGLAFLLGAADVNENALGRLPEVSESGGGLVLTFTCLDDASRGSAVLTVEHSSDLGIGDPWLASVAVDDDGSALTNGVTLGVSVNPGDADLNDVVATISSSEAAGGKLFARLKATKP